MKKKFWCVLIIVLFHSTLAHSASYLSFGVKQANRIAQDHHFQKQRIQTKDFLLTSYFKITQKGADLTIYIEGDGFAFAHKNRISSNPTPKNPLVLKLAVQSQDENIAYLARPCQYISQKEEKNFHNKFWSDSRFSQEVIASMNEAVDFLKEQAQSSNIKLIGFSGGGAVAVLLAAHREDIKELITIAGNLDTDQVNQYHKVAPLKDSYNPMDFAEAVAHIPQKHFAGGKDKIILMDIIKSFVQKTGDVELKNLIVCETCTHHDNWY